MPLCPKKQPSDLRENSSLITQKASSTNQMAITDQPPTRFKSMPAIVFKTPCADKHTGFLEPLYW
jgi:hypothetical protein